MTNFLPIFVLCYIIAVAIYIVAEKFTNSAPTKRARRVVYKVEDLDSLDLKFCPAIEKLSGGVKTDSKDSPYDRSYLNLDYGTKIPVIFK